MKRRNYMAWLVAPILSGLAALGTGVVAQAAPPAEREVLLRARDEEGSLLALRVPVNLFAQLQQGSSANVNLSQIGGASVSSSLYDSGNTALKVNCVVGCSATGAFTDNGIFTTGSTAVTNLSGLFNDAAANLTSGNAGAIRATTDRMLFVNIGKIAGTAPTLTGSSLNVNCTGGCSGSAGFTDNAAFTAGTTTINPVGGLFDDTPPAAITTGHAASARITNNRALHVNLRNQAGTEIGTSGTPVRIDPTGTTTQPVSGTVTSNQGTAAALSGAWPVKVTDGTNSMPTGDAAARTIHVTADNASIPVTESGTWTVQPGNTANTTPWLATDSADGNTGSAVPSKAIYVGGNASGNLTGIMVCDHWTPISLTANTQIIPGTASKQTYICSINLVSAAADNVAVVEGTGSTCATSTAGMAGGATAATGWNFAANGGIAQGSGLGAVMRTATAADNVCVFVSGATQVSGAVSWTQF